MTFPDTAQDQADPADDQDAFDLAHARARLGMPEGDTGKDALIRTALATALAIAERYCDRAFLFKSETVRFVRNRWPQLLVRRYPIERLIEIRRERSGQALSLAHVDVDREAGIVHVGHAGGGETLAVEYEGGFKVLPPDLLAALWMVFDQVWQGTPGMGLDPGQAAGPTPTVRSFAIDGMSIGYDNAAGTSGSDSGPGAWGAIPPWARATLDAYRAETVMGGA